MIQKLYKRGFTLIELLVVIAIIGILASVVLASLNTARDKGIDAANKSTVNNLRAQAELVYDNDDRSYDAVCNSDLGVVINAIPEGGKCDDTADAWAAEVKLISKDTTEYYCADSTGAAQETANSKGTATVCP